MKDKTIKKQIPVMVGGKMETARATFYPKRNARSFMGLLKSFLKETKGAHDCPHYLYIEAAEHWLDTGKEFMGATYVIELSHWKLYLEDKGLI